MHTPRNRGGRGHSTAPTNIKAYIPAPARRAVPFLRPFLSLLPKSKPPKFQIPILRRRPTPPTPPAVSSPGSREIGRRFLEEGPPHPMDSPQGRHGEWKKEICNGVCNGCDGNRKMHQNNARLMTIPTMLTLGRVAAVPLLVSIFYIESWWSASATTFIFLAAAITDWLDGYIARKMRLGTAFGAFLDPVADKLMVAATLVLLCTAPLEVIVFGEVPWLLTVPSIAVIGREITMSAVREWAASQNSKILEAVAVNNLGKWKTATQMTALTILLATRDSSLIGHGVFAASGIILLYISAGLAVWSLVVYMRKIWRILLK